jgi:magnesium chelatase family protein
MSLGRARSIALVGLEAVPLTVEAHVGSGLPGLHIIGAAGEAAGHAANRVRTALAAAGWPLPQRKALVSLSPADVPKAGARFDLAMALALAQTQGAVPEGALDGVAAVGELGLDAAVKPVAGVLPSVAQLGGAVADRVLVADGNAAEATLAAGAAVLPVADLSEAIAVTAGRQAPRPAPAPATAPAGGLADLADVCGQPEARRGLEVAAAGGHHLMLLGPPGCGKSMLAQRLPGLLPPLERAAALEVAAVRSVAGRLDDAARLDQAPPFRAPHHATTAAALLGGGSGVARPGELSLAHRGVLFMDELFEWPRSLLDRLREPLEEGVVRLSRAKASVIYPARVQLVCAANPCPCGREPCSCSDATLATYRERLSGPLADRLDLAPRVAAVSARELVAGEPGEPSDAVSRRVVGARAAADARWGELNAVVDGQALRATASSAALRVLADAVEGGALTARGFERALRVARTCADLAGATAIGREHASEAVAHRLALHLNRGRSTAGA